MDISLSPDQQRFRDQVRAFLAENLSDVLRNGAEHSPAVFVEPDVGREWQRILNARGWLAYDWPVEVGGTGWDPVERYIFEKECAEAGAPALPGMGLKLLGPVIHRFGTEEQKARILPRILSGEDYWCQGFSEPGSGSDLASLTTSAVRDGDRFIVNGSKMWTTHAHHANRVFCLVRTDQGAKRQAGISFLLLDLDQPGVSISPIITLAGDHEVNQLFFDNAVAEARDLVGEEGQGWAIAKFLLENERAGSRHAPWILARLDRAEAAAMVEPDGDGGLMAGDRDWRRRLSRLRLRALSLEILELRILAETAHGRPAGPQTSVIKLLASDLRKQVDEAEMDLHGPAGVQFETRRPLYGDTAPAAPFGKGPPLASARYLNSRAWTIFGGTNEVQSMIIAKTVLGL